MCWEGWEDGKKIQSSDDEKFYIFVTKDKRQAIILTMSCIQYLQVLTAKAGWNLLFLIVTFKLFYIKDNKRHSFDDTKEVQL